MLTTRTKERKSLDASLSFLDIHDPFYLFYILGRSPGGPDGKGSAYNAGDPVLIPGSGRSTGEGNGNALQYSCLENPMDRVAKSWT